MVSQVDADRFRNRGLHSHECESTVLMSRQASDDDTLWEHVLRGGPGTRLHASRTSPRVAAIGGLFTLLLGISVDVDGHDRVDLQRGSSCPWFLRCRYCDVVLNDECPRYCWSNRRFTPASRTRSHACKFARASTNHVQTCSVAGFGEAVNCRYEVHHGRQPHSLHDSRAAVFDRSQA